MPDEPVAVSTFEVGRVHFGTDARSDSGLGGGMMYWMPGSVRNEFRV